MSCSSILAPTTHDKFNGKEYLYGTADSLERFMCVSDGKRAIIDEFNTHGTAEDKEYLNYILYEEAGRSPAFLLRVSTCIDQSQPLCLKRMNMESQRSIPLI